MFDQIHFIITYTTFLTISVAFSTYLSNIFEFNENNILVNREEYMNLLHFCNASHV